MTRPKGLNPGVSKDLVQCPVEGCSVVKTRRDNWVSHIKTQVIWGPDKKPVPRESKDFKTNKNKDKQNHTLFFINGGFSLANLPSPILVEETVKEKTREITSMFQRLPAPASAGLEAEAEKTPSAVGHEESPQLHENSGVQVVGGGGMSPVPPSGDISSPSSSDCQICLTKKHY